MQKKELVLLVVVIVFASFCLAGCGRQKPLFNGRDLQGWKLFVEEPDVDVHKVWSVKDGVIHCAGIPNGYIRTLETYSDYKLHVEWRWPNKPTNSGVLLRASGPDKVWPRCTEAQLMDGHAGDFVLIGHDVGLTVDGKKYQDPDKMFNIIAKKHDVTENPHGSWNSYDITCRGDRIQISVNGTLQNQGCDSTETSGWICLQSEGSPIQFRNIYIEALD